MSSEALSLGPAISRPRTSWTSYRFAGAAFIVLCLFPWISFGLLDLDTQPWFIFGAIFICGLSIKVKADRAIVGSALLLMAVAAVSGLFRMDAADFLFVRGLLSYSAFGIVLLGYYYYRSRYGFPARIFVIANLIWLAAGAIQMLVGPDALAALVEVRTTLRRGVTGLAPEPSYYGVVLLFFGWILLIERGYRVRTGLLLLLLVNFAYILLIAKSAVALVYVVLLLAMYNLAGVNTLRRFFYAAVSLAVAVVATMILGRMFPNWRIGQIVLALASDPLLAVRVDGSMNQRFAHLVYALHGAIENWGLPGGFSSFKAMSAAIRSTYEDIFWYGDNEDKIMSGVGAVVYELGWFSVVFFAIVAFCTLSKHQLRLGIFHLVGFLAVFAGALPVAFPLGPILLITMLFWHRENAPTDGQDRASSAPPRVSNPASA